MLVNFTARRSDGRNGGSTILDQIVADVGAAFKRIERFAGLPLGYAPLDADGLIPIDFLTNAGALLLTPSTLHVSGTSGANASITVTLPAVAGKAHFITSIRLARSAAGAIAGAAVLTHTSTNLPGNPTWAAGNAIAAGQTIVDLDYRPTTPLRSVAPGVATTLTMVAAGALCVDNVNVSYFLGSP